MYRATSANATWQTFWYEKNLQGDVVAVYSHDGVKLVSYAYDAWGNTTITTHVSGTAASYNPFRYRGYYYDRDIGLYCLGTRWYSTQFRRFLSPDDVSYLGANGDLNSYNLYAYCSNNPVMYVDPTGHSIVLFTIVIGTLVGAFIGGGIDVCKQLIIDGTEFENINWGSVINSTLVGGALGFSNAMGVCFLGPALAGLSTVSTSATVCSFLASIGVSALAGGGGFVLQELRNGNIDKVSIQQVIGHAGIVAIEAAYNFGIGGMIGSIGEVGTKGARFSAEWLGKLILGQEFSLPFKYPLDKLRKGIWG